MIRDISQPLRDGMPVWPGDTAFTAHRTWHLSETVPVNVSKFTTSTHNGTHADAPFHYDQAGMPIDQVSLEPYIGPAQVIDVRSAGALIKPVHVLPALKTGVARVLLRTYERAPLRAWDSGFTAVSAELIDVLAERNVRLIGIDTPSLDPEQSKSMDAHHAVRRNGMAILEGLVLDDVPPGVYELIALPLKLSGLDASPVRAILRDLPNADHT